MLLSHPYVTQYGRVGPVLPIGLLNHNLSFFLLNIFQFELFCRCAFISYLALRGHSRENNFGVHLRPDVRGAPKVALARSRRTCVRALAIDVPGGGGQRERRVEHAVSSAAGSDSPASKEVRVAVWRVHGDGAQRMRKRTDRECVARRSSGPRLKPGAPLRSPAQRRAAGPGAAPPRCVGVYCQNQWTRTPLNLQAR